MKKTFYLLFAFIIFSCSKNSNENDTPEPLFPQPNTVELNTTGG